MPILASEPKVTDPKPSDTYDIWYLIGFSNVTNPFTKQSTCGAELMFGKEIEVDKEVEVVTEGKLVKTTTKVKKFIPYKDSDNNYVRVSFTEQDFFGLIKQKAQEGDLSYKILMDLLVEKIGQLAKERNILVVPS